MLGLCDLSYNARSPEPPHYMLIILQGHRQHALLRKGLEMRLKRFLFSYQLQEDMSKPCSWHLRSRCSFLKCVSVYLKCPLSWSSPLKAGASAENLMLRLERRLCSRSLSPHYDSLIWNSPECLFRVLAKVVCNFNRQQQADCWELQGILHSFLWVSAVF